jgi:hypothetical protein
MLAWVEAEGTAMNTDRLPMKLSDMSTPQIAGGAIGLALLVSLAGYGVSRVIRRFMPDRTGTSNLAPLQPAVDRAMQAEVPDHFSEELIVPGFTATGADIERQDETLGRSPEGV